MQRLWGCEYREQVREENILALFFEVGIEYQSIVKTMSGTSMWLLSALCKSRSDIFSNKKSRRFRRQTKDQRSSKRRMNLLLSGIDGKATCIGICDGNYMRVCYGDWRTMPIKLTFDTHLAPTGSSSGKRIVLLRARSAALTFALAPPLTPSSLATVGAVESGMGVCTLFLD